MINLFAILDFIKKQWLGSILIVIIVLYLIFNTASNNQIEYKNNVIYDTIVKHENKVDTLYLTKSKIVEKIKLIKERNEIEINNVDTMHHSSLELFFTKRYDSKGNTN